MKRILKSGVGSAAVHAAAFGGFLLLGFAFEKQPIMIDLTIMPAETMEPDADKGSTPGPAGAPAAPTPPAAKPAAPRSHPRPRAPRPEKPAASDLVARAVDPTAQDSTPVREEPQPTPAAASEPPSEGQAGPAQPAKGAAVGTSSGSATTAKGPGVGDGSASAQQAYLARHFAYIREAIQRSATYPPLARRMGWVGRVLLAFRILADGTVANVRVTKGAGFPVLDSGAIEAVRRAAPFPRPPAEAEIVVPVAFALE